MDPRLRQRAFRVGCVLWVALAVLFWVWLYRSVDDVLAGLRQGPAFVAPEPPGNRDLAIADDLHVGGILFGVLEEDEGGVLHLAPTARVENRPGTSFGWVAWLETSRPFVGFREVFRSASPENWSYADDGTYSLSEDGHTMTREMLVVPVDGRISHFWEIAEGDLPGPHRTTVFVEEVLVGDFEFEVR